MKYYEKLQYKLSRAFKNSLAMDLLDHQFDKEPNSTFRFIEFKEANYDSFNQGDKIKYEVDENTGNITVLLETIHEFKKKYVMLQLRRCGNEVNIIVRTPREDTSVVHIRHNTNNTVTSLSKRVKFYGRDDEQVLESRYALFSDQGDLLDYNEQRYDEFSQRIAAIMQKI